MRVEGVVLEDHGHVSIFGGRIVDDAAPNADGAPGDIFQTGDHAEGSCLAASRRTYKDHELAVLDLEIEIQDGEFMVFVGPSGCGKTTALRMIAGPVSYTHLRAHETKANLVCRLLLEKKKKKKKKQT